MRRLSTTECTYLPTYLGVYGRILGVFVCTMWLFQVEKFHCWAFCAHLVACFAFAQELHTT